MHPIKPYALTWGYDHRFWYFFRDAEPIRIWPIRRAGYVVGGLGLLGSIGGILNGYLTSGTE